MSVDPNILARRSMVHMDVDQDLEGARRLVLCAALPRPDDVRRLLALQEAVGDVAASLARGHTSLEREWRRVAAVAQDALEQQMLEEAQYGGGAA